MMKFLGNKKKSFEIEKENDRKKSEEYIKEKVKDFLLNDNDNAVTSQEFLYESLGISTKMFERESFLFDFLKSENLYDKMIEKLTDVTNEVCKQYKQPDINELPNYIIIDSHLKSINLTSIFDCLGMFNWKVTANCVSVFNSDKSKNWRFINRYLNEFEEEIFKLRYKFIRSNNDGELIYYK